MVKTNEREISRRGHVTRARLLTITLKELDRVGLAKIDVDSLLRRSKVSKGSLYHHFGSKNGLLAAAEAQQFMTQLKSEAAVFRNLIETCKSKKSFVDLVAMAIKITSLKENHAFRKKRVRAIAMSFNDKNLAAVLKQAQIEVSQDLANCFQIAMDRGWVKTDTNLLAFAYWIQGVFIGHIMLDITGTTVHDEAWSEVAIQSLSSFLSPD